MRIYAISGLGADERALGKLALDCDMQVLPWLKPDKNEDLVHYARRMSEQIDQTEPYGLLGLSFGGMVAVEMSKFLNNRFTILLSTAEVYTETPKLHRTATQIVRWLPASWCNPPNVFVDWFFGAKDVKLLNAILDDTDPFFLKWAFLKVHSWRNKDRISNVLKVQGEKDMVFPARMSANSVHVKDGRHFMVVDKAREVSEIINTWIAEQGFNR